MPTDKRQRKRDGRLARIEAERAAAKAAARRRRVITAVIATVAVFAALLLISRTGGDDDEGTAADGATTTTSEAGAPAAAASYGDTPCAPVTAPPAEPVRSFSSPFRDCLVEGVDYAATLTTEDGAFTIDLLEDEAPATVNNFVNLARSGFYDGSTFHRVLEDFVIQGGDPVGEPPGTGGPGTCGAPRAGAVAEKRRLLVDAGDGDATGDELERAAVVGGEAPGGGVGHHRQVLEHPEADGERPAARVDHGVAQHHGAGRGPCHHGTVVPGGAQRVPDRRLLQHGAQVQR